MFLVPKGELDVLISEALQGRHPDSAGFYHSVRPLCRLRQHIQYRERLQT